MEEKVTFFLLELLNQVCQLGKPIFAAEGSDELKLVLFISLLCFNSYNIFIISHLGQ